MGNTDYELYRQAQSYMTERRAEVQRLSLASKYGQGGLINHLIRGLHVIGQLFEPKARTPRRPSTPQLQ